MARSKPSHMKVSVRVPHVDPVSRAAAFIAYAKKNLQPYDRIDGYAQVLAQISNLETALAELSASKE